MDDQRQSRRWLTRKRVLWTVCIIAVIVGAYVLLRFAYVREWKWTGLVKNPDYHKRTLWDWLNLLIVPAVLALGGYLFTRSENQRSEKAAEVQRVFQRDLERTIADERSQYDMLQAYLDGMSQLLTDRDRPLHRAQLGDSLSTVARARTLTVLPKLDGERKARVVQFLYESGLIVKKRPIIDLLRADLRRADLRRAGLRGADLQGADMSGADLVRADLKWADLSFADLNGADLRSVDLFGAELSSTKVRGADLWRASLRDAKGWTANQLRAAKSLEEATMPDGKILGGKAYPDGPTFDEWVKDREDRKGDAKNA